LASFDISVDEEEIEDVAEQLEAEGMEEEEEGIEEEEEAYEEGEEEQSDLEILIPEEDRQYTVYFQE